MVTFLRYFGINNTVICCIAWIIWSTESKMISKRVGDDVTLNCSNTSVGIVVWTMNGQTLFYFKTEDAQGCINDSKNRLDLKFLCTSSQLYALAIENAQKFHEGNYTCEMTSDEKGVDEEHWELFIKEEVGKLPKELIAVVTAVPCACFVIIITVLVIFKCVQKRQTECNSGPPVFIRQQQPSEDIYENHLEIQRHGHALHHKPRPQ